MPACPHCCHPAEVAAQEDFVPPERVDQHHLGHRISMVDTRLPIVKHHTATQLPGGPLARNHRPWSADQPHRREASAIACQARDCGWPPPSSGQASDPSSHPGSPERLPGLLGLKSLEGHCAILDCGRQVLILPGLVDVDIRLPPGSLEASLDRAPSGHLVMILDQFDKIKAKAGGGPEPSIQLHAASGSETPMRPSGSASAVPPEAQEFR